MSKLPRFVFVPHIPSDENLQLVVHLREPFLVLKVDSQGMAKGMANRWRTPWQNDSEHDGKQHGESIAPPLSVLHHDCDIKAEELEQLVKRANDWYIHAILYKDGNKL